jgi:hypothetical protein
MAAPALPFQSQEQDTQLGQQEQLRPEPTPRTPLVEKPEDRLAKFGIGIQSGSDKLNVEEKLIRVWQMHIEDWAIPYRVALREALRGIEYDKGNQFIAWDAC